MLDNMSKQCDMRVDRLSGGMIRYDITVYIPSAGLDLLFKRGGWEAAVGDGSDDGGEATAEYHHVCRLHRSRPPRVAPAPATGAAAFQRASSAAPGVLASGCHGSESRSEAEGAALVEGCENPAKAPVFISVTIFSTLGLKQTFISS